MSECADEVAAGDPLFVPLDVAGMTFANRMLLAPMGTGLDEDGSFTEPAIAYYRRRAEGGVAAVTVEALLVDPATCGPEPRIDSDRYLPGLARLADAIHEGGSLAGAQLLHPGRQVLAGRHVGPSPIPLNSASPSPVELSEGDIADIVEMYARAAERVARAGYDYVEIHGAHGYLLSDFLSPLWNVRADRYGGDLAGRARFGREVVRAIRQVCPELPVFYRINGDEALPGGMTTDDACTISRWLEEDGVACLSVSAGHWRALHTTIAPMWMPRAHLVEVSAKIRREVSIPVIAVGRLDAPAAARHALTSGAADLIAIGRGLIADPDLPRKLATGHPERVRPCIACNACVDSVGVGGAMRCAVNPAAGHDDSWHVTPAGTPKRVTVLGSGPAGLEAARVAAERGHQVTIIERDDRLGGKLDIAASAPSKHEVLRFRDWHETELARLGVTVQLGANATPHDLAAHGADCLVVATGANAAVPPIPGIDLPHVRDAQDYLRGTIPVAPGTEIVVIGGSATGCETAEALVHAGAQVTIIEMTKSIGRGIEAITRRHLLAELRKRGVTLLSRAEVLRIDETSVTYRAEEREESIPAAAVALAIGWRPTGKLFADLEGFATHFVVGDADQPADFAAATHAGARAGLAV